MYIHIYIIIYNMIVRLAYEPTCPQTYFNIAMEKRH